MNGRGQRREDVGGGIVSDDIDDGKRHRTGGSAALLVICDRWHIIEQMRMGSCEHLHGSKYARINGIARVALRGRGNRERECE